jgi:hypothetical protein
VRGTVIIRPPFGRIGVYIQHHHHVVDGLAIEGGTVGLKLGPHRRDDWIVGVISRYNKVSGCGSDGIQFRFGVNGIVEFSTAFQNGQSGIKYSGNDGVIHDNVGHTNGDFGIYVTDGVNHQIWNNQAFGNGKKGLQILGSTIPPPGGRTFYVSAARGDDAYDEVEAQRPATPWQTTRRALLMANPGDFVVLLPGRYTEVVASIRDGAVDAPITIKAMERGNVTIQPPSGNSGILIAHHYHVVENLAVTGATVGLQIGPLKKTDGHVLGIIARNNHVYGNGVGIKFEAANSAALHNIIYDNRLDGILWDKRAGNGAMIFNNLINGNGKNLTGEYGISLTMGRDHVVVNNTLYGNHNGGIRLGSSTDDAVFSTVVNNIVMNSPVGIKEPGGEPYKGRTLLDHNNVFACSVRNYDLSGGGNTKVGLNSISLDPIFVNPAADDFRLGRRATGQLSDSPAIDQGMETAEATGLDSRTAFTDKHPDMGRVDLGYHETLLRPAQGTVRVKHVVVTLDADGEDLMVSAVLRPGPGNDGVQIGTEYAEVGVGGYRFFLPAVSFQSGGLRRWAYADGKETSGTVKRMPDGTIEVILRARGLAVETLLSSTTDIGVRVGDDFGATAVPLKGRLHYP